MQAAEEEAEPEPADDEAPQTGDTFGAPLWIGLCLLGLTGAGLLGRAAVKSRG